MSGGRKPRFSDEEILRFFVHCEDPVVTTGEIRDEFDYSTTSGANSRLRDLEDQGYIESKSAGPASVWWLTEAGVELLEDDGEE